jgi:stalled ribosome rescue protein Dom34
MSSKSIAVWMDYQQACILSSNGDEFEVNKTIDRDGHKDADYKNEHVEQSKETQELKKFFAAITSEIEDANEIFIFGPGKAQEQFKNVLKENHQFDDKKIELGSSDNINEHEMKKMAKAHFG